MRPHPLLLATLFALAALSGPLPAQVPFDHVVVLEATNFTTLDPNFHLVSVAGTGSAPVREQSVFVPFTSVTIDPADASRIFFATGSQSFAGVWVSRIEQGAFGTSTWGNYARSGRDRVEAGPQDVYAAGPAGVDAFPSGGGTGRTVVSIANPLDLCVVGPFVYVLGDDAAGNRVVVEANDLSGTQRTVGTFAGATTLDAPAAGLLLLGTDFGEVLTVDASTGNVLSTVATNKGAVVALAALGTEAVFATSAAVWSTTDLTNPLFVGTDPILDLALSRTDRGAAYPFGAGCGARIPEWDLAPAPDLGSPGFAFRSTNHTAGTSAVLLLGTDRRFSGTIGQPLPLDLAPLGLAQGCALLVDPAGTALVAADAAGRATVPAPLPRANALLGVELFGQWVTQTAPATGSTASLALSEAAAFVLR